MNIDGKTVTTGVALVGAMGVLIGYGSSLLEAAVSRVGGRDFPYASAKEEMQVAADVKTLKQSQPVILWQILENDATTCDNQTTVWNIEAKASRDHILKDQADKNDRHCQKLHEQADEARRTLLPR